MGLRKSVEGEGEEAKKRYERYGGRQGDKRKMETDQETKKRAEKGKELRMDKLEERRHMKQREKEEL